jgi:2-iminobutanoate/2-iminopropanoate deaminase
LIIPEVFQAVKMQECELGLRDGDGQPMVNRIHDIGIARQIATYSDAVEAPANARWLITAGTPGLDANGNVPPDIGAQAELAWTHILAMLKRADMSVHDLVKVTQYLLRPSDIAAYAEVRARHLGSARPASLLLIVPALVRPEFLLEIEAYAAKA